MKKSELRAMIHEVLKEELLREAELPEIDGTAFLTS